MIGVAPSQPEVAIVLAAPLLLVASLHDVAARTIPNACPLALAAAGVLLRIRAHDLPLAMLAAAAIFVIAAFAFARGLMGGGDVKLIGAAALLVPPATTPSLVLTIALAGGLLSSLYLTLSLLVPAPACGRPHTCFARIVRAELWRIRRRASLPYGAAISAGALLTMIGVAA